FYIERHSTSVKSGTWIAEAALTHIPNGRLYKLAEEHYTRAMTSALFYNVTGKIENELLIGALHLAKLDSVYREGPDSLTLKELKMIDQSDVEDLRTLMNLIPEREFKV